MPKYVIFTAMAAALGGFLYLFGHKSCQNQYLAAHQEYAQNVIHQKSKIYARPNADRNALLKLMRDGVL